ncbi:V-type proton ATPase subunit C isoform X2 [Hydra vulgaris]|uniref:V-type proton ATPase subunit C n=1 Tax=Hydra vulgaris TaxID=6087 RepID=A0ABM4BXS3_HYDVU
MASEFWLISAPGDKTPQQTFEALKLKTENQGLSLNYKLNLPELKVGTLDTLVGLSDDLGKLDVHVESITKKLASYFAEVLEEKQDKVLENLQINGMDPATYLTKFNWDSAKYPTKQALRSISEIISKQITQIDSDLKTKASAYNAIKASLQNLERKSTGSLLVRNLSSVVEKEHFILNSEYLQTLLVVVPKSSTAEWETVYEKITDMIVPKSSMLLTSDSDYSLYTVTLFKKVIDEFKHHARERKFIVRDFVWDDVEIAASKEEITKMAEDKKKNFGPLVRWLKVNFAEIFIAWSHVKALRVFVESVLRFGLPVNFQAMLIQPVKGKNRRLRDVLDAQYAHLDGQQSNVKGETVDIPGLMSHGEYYSYVYFQMKLNLLER